MKDWADQREVLLAAILAIVAIGECPRVYSEIDHVDWQARFDGAEEVARSALVACGELPPEMPVLRQP